MTKERFFIGDEVMIKAISVKAMVAAILIDHEGLQYRVVYWDEKSRKAEWLYSCEVEAIEPD